MSKSICVMGISGSGKTTSMRTLDPTTTIYIDCDGKGLSWRGWRSQYNAENKNYLRTDDPEVIRATLLAIDKNEKYKDIRTVVIDTLNGIMIAEELRHVNDKGYDKWMSLAVYVWTIIQMSNRLRDDLTVIMTAHAETISDDNGYTEIRIKTSGRKLEKMVPESQFTTVLLSDYVDGRYVFHTRAEHSTCKTPMGMFDDELIDNDITTVIKALEEY